MGKAARVLVSAHTGGFDNQIYEGFAFLTYHSHDINSRTAGNSSQHHFYRCQAAFDFGMPHVYVDAMAMFIFGHKKLIFLVAGYYLHNLLL